MEHQFSIIVSFQGKEYPFSLALHRAEEKEDLYMNIYSKESGLEFPHFEIEILESPISSLLHKHTTKGKKFVCWTGHLPTESMAENLAKWWACGEIYHHIFGVDYSNFMDEDRPRLRFSFFEIAGIYAVIEEGNNGKKTGYCFNVRLFLN